MIPPKRRSRCAGNYEWHARRPHNPLLAARRSAPYEVDRLLCKGAETRQSRGHRDAEIPGYCLSSLAHHDDILVEESCSAALGGVLSKRDEAAVDETARLVQAG